MKKTFPLNRSVIGVCRIILFFIIFCCSISVTAQIHLVKDINLQETADASEYASLTDVNGVLYFKSKDMELWKTDGTTAGSEKIKTFTHVYDLKKVGNQLFFFASDTSNASSLWKSDGTTAGTVQVSPKIVTGSYMTDVSGILFFIGNTVATGLEVWRSDGTAAGTYIVKDIMKGGGNSNPTSLVSFNGKLFFVANNGTNGYEIWTSDGTTAGTQIFKDLIPGKTGSTPNYLTTANNTLFFMARDASLGEELWKTDGTSEGTVLVKDIFLGSKSSFPANFVSAGNILYFKADDGVHNFQLWRSDGTDAGTIKLTTDGFNFLNGAVAADNYLYYLLGKKLYRTDGTVAGTSFISDIEDFYSKKEISELNGSVYIVSSDYLQGKTLWKITGTTATAVTHVGPENNYVSSALTSAGNYIYFTGTGSATDFTLWRTDGTPTGTLSILDVDQSTEGSYPGNLTDFNGILFFNAEAASNGGMWKSDGSEAGTVRLSPKSFIDSKVFNGNLIFGTLQSLSKTDGNAVDVISTQFTNATDFMLANGSLFFRATHDPEGSELCKTDGTEAGTVLVKDIYGGGWDGYPQNITEFNNQVFFSARDGSHGIELWKSDGTESGTVLVKDIIPGISSSTPAKLVVYNNLLIFFIYRAGVGFELWRSDGTESGTVFVKQVTPNSTLPQGDLIVSNGILYFTSTDANSTSLWKTDGTSAGTVKISDLFSGVGTSYFLRSYNNDLYMLINAGSNFGLWKSNGTASGTVMLKKIGIDNSSYPTSEIHNGHLYINVSNKTDNNATYENEVWRTDGTSCGTFRVDYQSNVLAIRHSGNILFAAGKSGLSGIELLRIEDNEIVPLPCNQREALADVSYDEREFASYPNPFNRTFSVRMDGKEDVTFSVKALNMSGVEMEHHQRLKTNTSYELGGEWVAGLYVLRIEIEGKYITKKILKQGN